MDVPALDQPPQLWGTPLMTTPAGAYYEFQPNVHDPDTATLKFSARGLPAWLSVNPSTGVLSGTPTNDDAGISADITLSVSDGLNIATLQPFRITVDPVLAPLAPSSPDNQPPSIAGTPDTGVIATGAWSFTPSASDPDSAQLTFRIWNQPSWASFNVLTGRLSGTPGRNEAGVYRDIVISVWDGTTSVSLDPFSITVGDAPNGAPSISGTPAMSVAAGTTYSFTPSAMDPDADSLTFGVWNKPTWATFNPTTGQLSGTPDASAVGTYPAIVITARDGLVSTSIEPFSITVTEASGSTAPEANAPPVIEGSPEISATAGTQYSFTPTASDTNGDPLEFRVWNLPSWATFESGRLSGTPTEAGVSAEVVVSVSDGTVSTSLAPFTITVTEGASGAPANSHPVIEGTAPTTVALGSAYTFTPTASDVDGDRLEFRVWNLPSWASFDAPTGRLFGTPTEVGTFGGIVISVFDGTVSSSLPPFAMAWATGRTRGSRPTRPLIS